MVGERRRIVYSLFILLVSLIYFSLTFAQPSLVSSDNHPWATNKEEGYIVYSREIYQGENMPIYVNVVNHVDANITFGWKQLANCPGIFGNMKFVFNGSPMESIKKNEADFKEVGAYPISEGTKVGFELDFKKGGKVWIRFPLPSNRAPSIHDLKADKSCPQGSMAFINWTANASDPENDPIFFKFFLNGKEESDWTKNNVWSWNTSQGDRIKVGIRDGKHADKNHYDDMIQRVYVEQPVIFNVDSENELRDAINNTSNDKLIYLKDIEFKGPIYIKNNASKIRIASCPDTGFRIVSPRNTLKRLGTSGCSFWPTP